MPSTPPDGEPAPADGRLPPAALRDLGRSGFGAYLHVPFCTTRCGYCDFNTYTATELDGTGPDPRNYRAHVGREIALARRVLGPATPPLDTVFFGGGTPTLLPPDDLTALVRLLGDGFGLAPDAEVTVEANPESVDEAHLAALAAGGVNRVSFGMQSARPHVLAALDRVHPPDRPTDAVAEARRAGIAGVNLDLIYGTPGETDDDWRASLDAALAAGPDHVSAYALTVEPGTRLAAKIRRGELAAPDDDVLAERYAIADERLSAAGLAWYEVSNWARTEADRCRHNLGYWRGGDWWGFGPGAHSHVGGVRWWNERHPSRWAERLARGRSPARARERLDAPTRRFEAVMLGVRLADGLPLTALDPAGVAGAHRFADDGLLEPDALAAGTALLTRRGRLLADAVVRALTG